MLGSTFSLKNSEAKASTFYLNYAKKNGLMVPHLAPTKCRLRIIFQTFCFARLFARSHNFSRFPGSPATPALGRTYHTKNILIKQRAKFNKRFALESSDIGQVRSPSSTADKTQEPKSSKETPWRCRRQGLFPWKRSIVEFYQLGVTW